MEAISPGTINYDPSMGWLNPYRKMKEKFKQNFDDNMYQNLATNAFLSMFEYDEKEKKYDFCHNPFSKPFDEYKEQKSSL
mgnify:CR=1 FL=1